MFPEPIRRLIYHFQKLPGIGPKQAARFAFRLLAMSNEELASFARDVETVRSSVDICKQCFLSFSKDKNNLCRYCRNASRRQKQICVVETDREALAIEASGIFKGVYHVLRSPALADARFGENHPAVMALIDRIQRLGGETEIILGLSATTEGRATALFIESVLKANKTKITRLGRGLSSGIEIEYADRDTLVDAFRNRK